MRRPAGSAPLDPVTSTFPDARHKLVLLPQLPEEQLDSQALKHWMRMTQQNGIDILCDAAGSDMLLSSFFSLGTPVGTPVAAPASTQPVVKRVRLTNDTSPSSTGAPSNSSNVCYICKRVYERADHLTRHMRSHENARPYACTRCPKRFNRAYVPPLDPLPGYRRPLWLTWSVLSHQRPVNPA